MKKILLELFILGTLGMAQSNYEVYVKSGVKISQSEVDKDSKEITNLVNKEIIERYVPEGKKISKKLYQEYIKKSSTELLENIPKRQKQAAKEYFDKTSKIIENNFLNVIDNLTILISEISFLEKNKAKVRLVSNSKDIDDFDTDEILDEAFEKANISYKEMDNIEKMSKAKLDNFYKYLDEKFKEKLNDLDYVETYSEIEVKKINGKWELEYDFNTSLNEIMNGFNTNDD
ncbi:hypothetical protein [Leptotrichia sp. oral taxon 223]|uniref:hypothetical protein n=1 Tax=Leptotrichia sp. oral taxon 223 TaxID=712363 RepID=UPI0015C0FB4C|nr:hypothetical protein [Leptotrichia sp. oral taxon 223]NWO18020.1 hypothetical protein [Leptotrichia sp. oral taxon 223]